MPFYSAQATAFHDAKYWCDMMGCWSLVDDVLRVKVFVYYLGATERVSLRFIDSVILARNG